MEENAQRPSGSPYMTIHDIGDQTITTEQAYNAMYAYFSRLYERTKNDQVGSMLSDLSLVRTGGTADPAAIYDWLECVNEVREGKVDSRLRAKDGTLINLHEF